jgi:type I restriction enzyme M protein
MAQEQNIVAKLWHLCNILRESGISYPEYVTELTYVLFLKMAQETGAEKQLPAGYRWEDLSSKSGKAQFQFYSKLLRRLASADDPQTRDIFADAKTILSHPKYLSLLVEEFTTINWYAARQETAFGDAYEGLLEKNSAESKTGAGQYFTPRPVVDCMVELAKPQPGEIIQDPACGTAGFLIAADRYIKRNTDNLASLSAAQARFQQERAIFGVELVSKTHKLALMNSMLHGIRGTIIAGDALGEAGESLPSADLILTNPPFGSKKGGGLPTRALPFSTSNKQLCFLQHIYLGLRKGSDSRPGGRAAVVIPDLQGHSAPEVLADLMDKCDLHTVLRLPTGIFYAQGVKTNVYFFTRGKTDTGNTKNVWVYDLRSNLPTFNKSNPLTRAHFAEFEKAFGSDPYGKSKRRDEGEQGRFRCFTREYIRENGDSLDITWLNQNGGEESTRTTSPDIIAKRIETKLQFALKELAALAREAGNHR